jgi:two-component system, sensor histidine kinase and response regulator
VTLRGEVLTEDAKQLRLRFSVKDTGPGIAAINLPRLFTAFEQVDNSASREHGGTGLGLAITRHLAQLMGGQVGVDSVPGQGSHFWLKILVDRSTDRKEASVEPAGSAIGQMANRQQTAHILLAEDDPVNRQVAVELLSEAGCRVDTAVNGEEAVKMAADRHYDLILMDVQMPVLNGIDATVQIRQLAQCKTIPILAMTANVLADDRARCLQHGMNDFIPKPVEPERLCATLLRWLPKSAPVTTSSPPLPAACQTLSAVDLAATLKRLAKALAAGDHEASVIFRQIEAQLAATHGEALDPLKNAIAGFDYEAAGPLLAELTAGQ